MVWLPAVVAVNEISATALETLEPPSSEYTYSGVPYPLGQEPLNVTLTVEPTVIGDGELITGVEGVGVTGNAA